ncbi:hypothetical protein Q5424_19825 [Conexibacter sp. JD483]|uniref:hypothetical protein n=1 Tax=unclassified Conexibacter TaxID=2627773 RepID=UPI00271DCCD5|nr:MULTISPECIES: hypothetical protein [unclassified Conexibacter]MDO8184925.1 hypothetical protein [Conexibacter sp. CPCC 205706]MDO8198069.1 hypothetical protein [Conexibacter sp. CPCC 205762]MDR9371358.1 hypothetical protein [Conexibacter sp. JD483]
MLLAVAGCGSSGGDDSATVATAAPDGSAAFVRAAWDVCDGLNAEIAAVPRSSLTQQDPARDTAVWLEQVIRIRRDGASRLAQVEVPADAKGEYDQFVALIGEQTDSFQRIHDAMASGDRATADAASTDSAVANEKQNAIARRLGIDGCAGG